MIEQRVGLPRAMAAKEIIYALHDNPSLMFCTCIEEGKDKCELTGKTKEEQQRMREEYLKSEEEVVTITFEPQFEVFWGHSLLFRVWHTGPAIPKPCSVCGDSDEELCICAKLAQYKTWKINVRTDS